jgi:RNA polymerase subunit RPABC4/transcription elongation factor Spt4
MPVIAAIVICKKCGYEIRSDWKFCPMCGDKIVCTNKYGMLGKGSKSATVAKKPAKRPVKKSTKK